MKPDAIFLNEALENLDAMQTALRASDAGDCGPEQIQSLFRCAHSVKGGAAAFGLNAVAELMHLVESFLDPLRQGRETLDPHSTSLLREAVDAARGQLSGDTVGARWAPDLVQRLQMVLHVPVALDAGHVCQITIGSSVSREAADAVVALFSDIAGLGKILSTGRGDAGVQEFMVRTAAHDHELRDLIAMHVERDSIAIQAIIDPVVVPDQSGAGLQAPSEGEPGETGKPGVGGVATEARHLPERTDALGEEDRATQADAAGRRDAAVAAAGISGQAQPDPQIEPASVLFARLQPLLRHLSARLNKPLNLAMVGQDLRIDRALLQALADPLVQLVRNACDHGIEAAAARAAAGKPPAGQIGVSAWLRQGRFWLSVRDDGGGLSRQELLHAARARAIPVADDIDDQRLWQLVFTPGLSTAAEVSDVSGRGVGMDVVRHRVAALGGDVSIDSSAGVGTCVTISVPMGAAPLAQVPKGG
jgi:two-component system chemotaxis sensor kinase CheA